MPGNRNWSDSEDSRLRQLWADNSIRGAELAQRMRRSPPACWHRARALGLPARGLPRSEVLANAAAMRERAAAIRRARQIAVADISDGDARWLAGLLDGTGYLGAPPSGSPHISLLRADRPLVAAAFAAAGGIGRISRKNPRNPRARCSWQWAVEDWAQIAALLRAVAPHMRARRRTAEILIGWPEDPEARQKAREELAYLALARDLPATEPAP